MRPDTRPIGCVSISQGRFSLRSRVWLRPCRLAALLFFAASASAQDSSQFAYVNAEGQVQHVDSAGLTPEPYRSAYAMKRRAGARGEQAQHLIPSDGPDEAARVERQRAQWAARAALAREQLLGGLGALVRAEQTLGEAKQNPLLAVTPEGRARIQRAQSIYDATLGSVRGSERLLTVTLPEEARRAQVPLLWLEP